MIQVDASHVIAVITSMAFDKKRNWVIKDSVCPGSTTEMVTKWKAETNSPTNRQQVGERNRLYKPQFWPTQTGLEPHYKLCLLK